MFLAVWPPPDVVATLDAVPRPDVAGVRWVPDRNLHVTLRFLGDVDDVDGAQETSGDRLRAAPAAAAQLGPAVDRFGNRVLHVPVAGLDDLARAVREPDDPPFRGHVTLARSRGARLAPLTGAPVSARWPVGEVTLVASHLGTGPSAYQVVARFLLR
ncbi:MAG TPA: 2'-5' RNA ligase family protein [Acidimicrobiales bacterium]|nr:2'-5' RNA ligase family protein [Acidimicrobiales bacterium]